jgi:hypothetical protein
MLLSPSALQHLVQHRVLGHLLGSDHLPLAADCPEPEHQASTQQQCHSAAASHSAADHPQQGQRDSAAVHHSNGRPSNL